MAEGDAGGEYLRLTYQELAARRGIHLDTARALVRRHRWHRERGNDGVVRVVVPIAFLEAVHEKPEKLQDQEADSQGEAIANVLGTLRDELGEARQEVRELRERAADAEARARAAEAVVVELRDALAHERERAKALSQPWWVRWFSSQQSR